MKVSAVVFCLAITAAQIFFAPAFAQCHGGAVPAAGNTGASTPHCHVNFLSAQTGCKVHFRANSSATTTAPIQSQTNTSTTTPTQSGSHTSSNQNGLAAAHHGFSFFGHHAADNNPKLFTSQMQSGGWHRHSDTSNHYYASLHPTNYHHQLNYQIGAWQNNRQSPVTLATSLNANGSLAGETALPNAFGLDLNSTQATIAATGISHPVTILVGGIITPSGNIVGSRYAMTINPGEMLTPAQYAVVQQVVTSGQQTLVINARGAAVSGLLTLAAGAMGSLSSIVVPRNVTVDTVGFTSSNPLNIAGSSNIRGTFDVLQQIANTAATVDFGSLIVGGRGSITDAVLGAGSSGLLSSSSLNLNVLNNVFNYGSINSTGTLSILSGGSIGNLGRTASMSGTNVFLRSNTGNFQNSGQIVATTGKVQFNAPFNQNIIVNNTGGTVRALKGAIDIRGPTYKGIANITLTGGNYLSQQLNLNDGQGAVNANVGNVTGQVTTTAQSEHFSASTANLIIGNSLISGDPTYYNTGGAVTIAGNLIFSGQALAIVANTNILTAAGAGAINTSSSTASGGAITMIAGANFTSTGAAIGSNDTTSTLTITGNSSTGGYIDLNGSISGSNVPITSFTSASTSTTVGSQNGGNINLVAYSGTGAGSGTVTLPATVTIASGGNGSGSNGQVTMIAGANASNALTTGGINTIGGTGAGGSINLFAATPSLSSVHIKNGAITGGSISAGASTTTGGITIAGNVTGSGALAITSGTSAGVTVASGNAASGTSVTIATPSLTNNGNITATTGNVIVQSNGTSNVLVVNMGPSSSITATHGNISFNGASAKSGSITMIGGNGALSANGGSGTVTFNGGGGIVNVDIASISGIVSGTATGTGVSGTNAFNLIVETGNLVANNIVSSGSIGTIWLQANNGNLTASKITSASSGDIVLYTPSSSPSTSLTLTGNISSGATLWVTDLNAGSVTIQNGVALSASGNIKISTPTLNNNGSVTANGGELDVVSYGTNNALTVNMGANGSFTGALGYNVNFNQSNIGATSFPGAIIMIGGNGKITASGGGQVLFNGGNNNVNVDVHAITGSVTGSGNDFNIKVETGNLSAAAINSANTNVNATVELTSVAGSLSVTGNISNSITPVATTSLTSHNDLQSSSITGTIYTNNLNLTSTNGSINGSTSSATFSTNAPNITANAPHGSINITATAVGGVTINGPSSAATTFTLISTPGGIVLGANVSGTAVTMIASGSGAISQTAGIVTGTTSTTFTSGSGTIGSVNIFTPVWTANTTGNVTLVDSRATTGNGTSTGANISFTDTAGGAGAITTTNPITATGTLALLSTGINGGVALHSNVSGTAVTIAASGAGAITQTASTVTGTISSTFTSGSGAIGSLNIITPVWTAATTGNVTLIDSKATTGNGASTGANISFTDSAGGAGALTTSGPIIATGTLSLLSTGADGGVILGGNVSGTVVTITAKGAGIITQTAGVVTGTTSGTFTSGSGAIGPLNIATPVWTATTTGNVTLADSEATTGNGVSTGANISFTDTAGGAGALTTSNTITATGTLSLLSTGANGGVILGANVTGTVVTISATGSGAISQTVGTVTGKTSIILTSGSGNIGSMKIVTPVWTANTTGNVTLIDSQATTGNGISTGANISFTDTASPGSIVISNNITAMGTLLLQAGANGGSPGSTMTIGSNISGASVVLTASKLNNNATVTANTGDLTVQSNGTGNALTVNLGSASSLIAAAGNVNFNGTGAGSITIQPASGSTPLGVISANGGVGNVNLNIGSGTATVSANSISGTVLDPNANFSTPASGNVSIIANTGSLTIGNFATASGKSISATTNASNGNINTAGNLKAGTSITLTGGSNGSVTIASGNSATAGTTVTMNGNVVTNNGTVKGATGIIITTGSLTNNGAITATTGNLAVQGTAGGHQFQIALGNGSTMTAASGNVTFNNTTPGQIIISGGSGNYGLISASNAIILNGGAGTVTVSVNQLIGCVEPTASQVSIQTQTGNINFCNGVNTSSASGSGGIINIRANGGAVSIGNTLNASGSGSGKSAGAITINGANGVTFTNIIANGNGGAGGGAVSITSNGQAIIGNYISATGSGGNGGSVTTASSTLVLNGVDSLGNSVNTQATAGGNGGTVTITTTAPQPFIVGGGNVSGNGSKGNINANGVNGGSIAFSNNGNPAHGNQVVNAGFSVLANGTTGSGGSITFQSTNINSEIVTINGLVQATNNADTLGQIAINPGSLQNITVLGVGTIWAGQSVQVGPYNSQTTNIRTLPPGPVFIAGPPLIIRNPVTFVPPIVPITPSGPANSGTSSRSLLIAQASFTSSGLLLPSLTATDVTQIFGYINFNIENDEERDDSRLANANASDQNKNLIAGTTLFAFHFGSDEIARLANDGVILGADSGNRNLNLLHGNVLLSPDTNILVATKQGTIQLGRGSTVFIMAFGGNVVLYDLLQTKPDQVSVVVAKRKLVMEPGSMLALTNQDVANLKSMSGDFHTVAYRRTEQVLSGNVKGFAANFSITSAINNIQPLKQLKGSAYQQDQITVEKLLKNAQIEGDFAHFDQPFQNADMGR